jgi:Tfp pilus assembly protein PilX
MKPARGIKTNERGIALILTLAILVIATILVVGFATSMRTERQASVSIANNVSATIIAQAATDHAITILDKNIPQPVPPGASTANPTNWIINPGLLTTIQGTAAPAQIPLSSNPSVTYSSTTQDAELNVPQLSGSGFTILPTSASMRVAWIPVLKDPSTATSATNQIVGRYGFWIDDESAKININTAVGKPNTLDFTKLTPGTITVNAATYPLGHPSSVNLDVLGTINTGNLANAVAQQGGLTSIEAIKPYVPSGTADTFLNSNKFALTAFSRDPEFNVFGKSRLYLYKQIVGAGFNRPLGRPLFQLFRDLDAPMYFHGDEAASADKSALYYTAANIAGITIGATTTPGVLSRSDWPGMPARSFVDKWDRDAAGNSYPGLNPGEMGKREADQVAWNMISMGNFSDYGTTYTNATSAEFNRFANVIPIGQPGSSGTPNYPNGNIPIGPLGGHALVPLFPRPLINEVALILTLEDPPPPQLPGKYVLKVSMQVELWLPPGYPDCDYSAVGSDIEVGLTYLAYDVTQGADNEVHEDTKYISTGQPYGVEALFGFLNTAGARQEYPVIPTTNAGTNGLPRFFYIYSSNSKGYNPSATGATRFDPQGGNINVDVKMRLFAHSVNGSPASPKLASSLVPIWDSRDTGVKVAGNQTWDPPKPATALAAFKPPVDDQNDFIEFNFQIDPATLGGGQQITRSLEVADPRLGGLARMWKPAPGFNDPTNAKADTLGAINQATVNWDTKKFAFVDFSNPSSTYRPPVGMFSLIPTGMQRGIAGATLKLQPRGAGIDLPDWLLLDLLSPSVDASNYPNLSFMNSTAGKVNVNAPIYPTGGSFAPPQRWQPLQALFQNMSDTTTVAAGATSPSAVVNNILSHQLSAVGPGTDFGAVGEYDYPGEVCEIAGVADTASTDWDNEAIVRYMASNLATKSNVFSVWGVAQTVKKNPANNNPANQGVFESKATGAAADDTITGEKRFEAVVERYVWLGKDAIPGQGHVNAAGAYDQLSTGVSQPGNLPAYAPAPTWERIDGPDAPTYPVNAASGTWNQKVAASYLSSGVSIENANNPLRAVARYRVIYFRYLTE